jgi:hypothetical protein
MVDHRAHHQPGNHQCGNPPGWNDRPGTGLAAHLGQFNILILLRFRGNADRHRSWNSRTKYAHFCLFSQFLNRKSRLIFLHIIACSLSYEKEFFQGLIPAARFVAYQIQVVKIATLSQAIDFPGGLPLQ